MSVCEMCNRGRGKGDASTVKTMGPLACRNWIPGSKEKQHSPHAVLFALGASPLPQAVHAVLPGTGAMEPVSHTRQVGRAPASANVPGRHAAHDRMPAAGSAMPCPEGQVSDTSLCAQQQAVVDFLLLDPVGGGTATVCSRRTLQPSSPHSCPRVGQGLGRPLSLLVSMHSCPSPPAHPPRGIDTRNSPEPRRNVEATSAPSSCHLTAVARLAEAASPRRHSESTATWTRASRDVFAWLQHGDVHGAGGCCCCCCCNPFSVRQYRLCVMLLVLRRTALVVTKGPEWNEAVNGCCGCWLLSIWLQSFAAETEAARCWGGCCWGGGMLRCDVMTEWWVGVSLLKKQHSLGVDTAR